MSKTYQEELFLENLREEFDEAHAAVDVDLMKLISREIRNRGAGSLANACDQKIVESQQEVDWGDI